MNTSSHPDGWLASMTFSSPRSNMKIASMILALWLPFSIADAAAQDARGSVGAATADAAKALLTHHLSSFQDNDLDAVVSDYTDESVLVTPEATYTGRKEIRGFFSRLIPQFPKQGTRFQLDKMVVNEGLVFIVWHATTPTLTVPLASDTFLVKDGKILRQTFVGQLQRAGRGG
jgi:predicted SnoaL-like aldol condensation-catalyzing enzyme